MAFSARIAASSAANPQTLGAKLAANPQTLGASRTAADPQTLGAKLAAILAQKAILREDRRQLGGEPADPRRLLHDDDAPGLGGGGEQRSLVERLERADVEHLDRDVVERVRRL